MNRLTRFWDSNGRVNRYVVQGRRNGPELLCRVLIGYLRGENTVVVSLVEVRGFMVLDGDSVEPFDPFRARDAGDDGADGVAMPGSEGGAIHLDGQI